MQEPFEMTIFWC